MPRWAAGLLCCAMAVGLALMVVSQQVSGQKAPAAPAAGSDPNATAKAPAATSVAPVVVSFAPGTPYAQRFAALCAACHGANGRTDMPLTPMLAGQPSLYVITQLFLFREGRRSRGLLLPTDLRDHHQRQRHCHRAGQQACSPPRRHFP